jgi:hypothetical protein
MFKELHVSQDQDQLATAYNTTISLDTHVFHAQLVKLLTLTTLLVSQLHHAWDKANTSVMLTTAMPVDNVI